MRTVIVMCAALGTALIGVWWACRSGLSPAYRTSDEKTLQGVVRTSLDSPNPTRAQLDRRARSIQKVKVLGLPCMENLPVIEEEASVSPRSNQEVVRRCVAVAICAVKGETQDLKLVDELIGRFSASDSFSPKEIAFVRNAKPTKQECINFAWQYERLHVLLWALGYIKELKPANENCDVAADVAILRGRTLTELVARAKPRPMAEILDMADLYYRLHWSAIELRLKRGKSDKVDEGIVVERHHALNWLIGYMKQSWDDVSTDT